MQLYLNSIDMGHISIFYYNKGHYKKKNKNVNKIFPNFTKFICFRFYVIFVLITQLIKLLKLN